MLIDRFLYVFLNVFIFAKTYLNGIIEIVVMVKSIAYAQISEQVKELRAESMQGREAAKEILKYLDDEYTLMDLKFGHWKSDLWTKGLDRELDEIRKLIKLAIKRCKLHIGILKRQQGWEVHLAMIGDKNSAKELAKLEARDEYVLKDFIGEANEAKTMMVRVSQQLNSSRGRVDASEFKRSEEHCKKFLQLMDIIMSLLMKTVEFLREEHGEIIEIMNKF